MKKILLLIGAIATIMTGISCTTAETSSESLAIDELNMGLSKSSVFEDPTPVAPIYPSVKGGKSDLLSRAYSTIPPQVPHSVEMYLPISLVEEENDCLDCHDRRKLLGKTWVKGKKLPMPDNHYGSFGKEGGMDDVAGARYNCTQCHVAMSDAQPLVGNTFIED